jgi:hypothetical protein
MAIFRTRALIHVFESHSRRGYFCLYNYRQKKLLILLGAKTMSYSSKYVRTNFLGRFYGKFALGDEKLEKKYLKMKEEALANSEKTSMSSAQVRYKEQRDLILYLLRKNTQLTYQELANLVADYDIMLSFQQIAKICAKFGDVASQKDKEALKDTAKKTKKKEKDKEIEENSVEMIETDEKEDEIEDFE